MNLIAQFEDYLRYLDRSPQTLKSYCSDLRQVQKWLGPKRSLASIKPADVRAYRDHMITIGAKASTINRHLASLLAFGQWGETRAHIFKENPAMYVDQLEQETLAPRWLSKKQKQKFLKVVDDDLRNAYKRYPKLWFLRHRDAVIVNLLLSTGLRVGELCNLRIVDLVTRDDVTSLLVRSGKGRKQRYVVLSAEARKQLSDWLKIRPKVKTDRIFIGQHGEKICPRIVQRFVARYAKDAGLENISPHALRHTFAKSLLDSGASLNEVAKLLGHKSLDSTARYTQPSEADLQIAVERMSRMG